MEELTELMKRVDEALGTDDPLSIRIVEELADLNRRRGNRAEAARLYDACKARAEDGYGDHHSETRRFSEAAREMASGSGGSLPGAPSTAVTMILILIVVLVVAIVIAGGRPWQVQPFP
ncbi:MAG: hypothetical protein HY815_31195 [Candidatus Riflebacteria bacterium]|nr:hypothetical protein [Candidatus Riflebacteria bacterium]